MKRALQGARKWIPILGEDVRSGGGLFAERGSGFTWNLDVKIDILENSITGMADRHYNRHVER